MVEYSAVVLNHGVHPSESLIKRSGFLRGILLVASAILLKTARFRADFPAHAQWLVSAIGADYFDRASVVYFGKHGSDRGLAHVRYLRTVDRLVLLDTNVTDNGLAQLKGLSNLKWLALSNTQVTDAGVEELQRALPTLKIVLIRSPATGL
jgi:hypothetical protein